jgi:hypothetical protein
MKRKCSRVQVMFKVQDARGLYKTSNKRKLKHAERNLSAAPWGRRGLLLLQSNNAVKAPLT